MLGMGSRCRGNDELVDKYNHLAQDLQRVQFF